MFVNADLIAAGLSPFAPGAAAVRAGRIMLGEIKAHARRGESFAFETTLSGLMYARLIPQWQRQGYHVKLIYLSLVNADLAVARKEDAGSGLALQQAIGIGARSMICDL